MSIQDQITAAANAAGVPSWLALAIAQRESGFNNNAVGSAGESASSSFCHPPRRSLV